MKSIRLKASVAMLAVATLAFSTQAGDDLTWSGDSGNYSAPANWTSGGDLTGYTSIFDWKTDAPGKNIRFGGAAAGKMVTMDILDNRVWNCWFYNGATPVTFAAADTTTGFEAYWGFHICAAANDVAALTVINGLYTTPSVENTDNASSWGTGDDAKFTLNLAGGKIDLWGHKGTDGLYLTHGKGVASTINITGGTLAVANDIAIGNADTDDTSSTTISISNGGSLSCGTATVSKWLKFPAAGTGKTTINLNAGGTLALWHFRHEAAGQSTLNFNGGTLKVLGDIGYGIISYNEATDASTMVVTLQENGGIIDTDFNTSLNNPVSGSGSLTKKGTGRLTFNVMPVFTGTLTVAEGAGSVILPAGATITAGTNTRTRAVTDGVEYYYGLPEAALTEADVDSGSLVLTANSMLTIGSDTTLDALSVSGPYTLTIAGDSTLTVGRLTIAAGTTVQLASGATLATGALRATTVTGAGVIGYTGVEPDALTSWADSANWTGTVWVRGLTQNAWNPSALGNALSTLRISGFTGYFAQAYIVVPFAVELENDTYDFAANINNGYSYNPNGKAYFATPTLKGSGTYTANGTGGSLFIVTTDWSEFTGVFNLTGKTVWLGFDAPGTSPGWAADGDEDSANGTVAGGIRIAAGKSLNWNTAWTLTKFFGDGTIKMAAPWDATTAFAGYVGDSTLWTGTVELAAHEATASVSVWPARMGNANSTVVFKGLTSNGGSHWLGDTTVIAATWQLDGDCTIDNGSQGSVYTIDRLTGTGNLAFEHTASSITININKLDGYTGELSALSYDRVNVGAVVLSEPPAVDTKLFTVTTTDYHRNVFCAQPTVLVGDDEYICTAELRTDGYYITAAGRTLYWVGGERGAWNEDANWALSNGAETTAPVASCIDHVVFTNDVELTVSTHAYANTVTLDADVTLKSASNSAYLRPYVIDGNGTLRLAGAWIGSTGRVLDVYSPVEVVTDTENWLACNSGYRVNIRGNLSGSGTLKAHHSGSQNTGAAFYGDNSAFAGTFESTNYNNRDATYLASAKSSSAGAVWKVDASNSKSTENVFPSTDNAYKYFGAYQGTMWMNSGTKVEIGARDDIESTLYPRAHTSYNGYTIRKVGGNLLTLNYTLASNSKTKIASLEIAGGSVALAADYFTDTASLLAISFTGTGGEMSATGVTALNAGLFVNSTAPIVFNDGDVNCEWSGQVAASNVGGLTKKGAGTLTLTAVPLYKGPTVVTAGKLVVPFGTKFESLTLEGDAKVEVDMSTAVDNALAFSSGKFTGDAANVTLQDNAPEGYSGVQSLGSDETIIYGNGSRTFTWVGPTPSTDEGGTDDYLWTTPSNWSVSDESTTDYPTALDDVVFNTGKPGFNIVADMTVKSVTVNGSDSFTFEAYHTLTVLGDFKLTNGGTLYVSGAGALEVNGSLSGVNMVEMSAQSATYAIISAHPYYTEKLSATEDLEVTWLAGAGTIASSADQTVTIADEDATSTFFGTLSGAMGLKKAGAGTLELQGPNTFTGDVAIDAGTLKLGSIFDSLKSSCRYQFAADDTRNFSFVNGSTTQIATLKGAFGEALNKDSGTYAEYVESDSDYFNGKPFIKFQSGQYSPTSKHYSSSSVFVYQKNTAASGNECLGYYKSDSNIDYFYINGASWYLNNNGTQNAWALFSDGAHSTAFTVGKKSVVAIDKWMVSSANREDHIGTSFNGAVAEAWGFTKILSLEERAAAEAYLMQKWGCDDAEDHQILPKTANVTMKAGTTLDLGGMTQTVKSFAGAGTVRNGALKTATGVVTATGALTVPAVAGQTYVMAAGNLTLTGDETAKGVFIQVPDGAKAVGRLIVPHGWTVGADAACDVVVTDLPKNWNVRPQREGDDTDQWFIGPNAFVLHLR